MNILLIQNDIRRAIPTMELIDSLGYQIILATNGAQALHKIKNVNFDLLLIDLQIPDISVERFLKDIKALRPEVKIITMLDNNSPELEKLIRSLGIVYYLPTQYFPMELASILQHISKRSTNIFQ